MIDDTALLREIDRFLREHGYAISTRELMVFAGNTSPSTMNHRLQRLRRQGRVDWLETQPRTLHLTERGRAMLDGA